MAKEKYNEEDGVWRTVGGRRIFIKNGQSLSDAMKASGKFKTSKAKNDEDEKGKKLNETMDRRAETIDKLDEETKGLDAYDRYNLAISKLEDTSEMKPTERQYWAGIKERYEKNQSKKDDETWRDKLNDKDKRNEILDKELDESTKKKTKEFWEKEDAKKENVTKSDPSGLNTKEDYEHDLKWFEEMEEKYPTKGGLENNEDYQSLKEEYESEFKTKWGDNGEKEYEKYKEMRLDDPSKYSDDDIAKFNELDKKYLDRFGKEPTKVVKYRDEYAVIENGGIQKTFDNVEDAKKFESELKSKADNEPWTEKIKDKDKRNEILDRELDESTKKKVKEYWEKEDAKAEKDQSNRYEEIDSKSVVDSDGFTTDYTMYKTPEGKYKMVFGDKDLYSPEDTEDIEFDNLKEAKEWFNEYKGFVEDEDENVGNNAINNAIREKASKKKQSKPDLPKRTEIKEQGTSNRKEVSENIQAHILDYYDSPQDFVEQMEYMNEPNMWRAGEELASGGSYAIYYEDQRDFLNSLKINPKGKEFSDDKVFDTYKSLIGRESAKLYERLKRNAYNDYKREHPLSKMTFEEFKSQKK